MTRAGSSGSDYYREQLRLLIWSGSFNEEDLQLHLVDLSGDDDARPHVSMLAKFGDAEIADKRAAEATWPAETDCDRLDAVFDLLDERGILALGHAGYTASDAHAEAWQMIGEAPPGQYRGFCFYHGQDVERAVLGLPLSLGFDAVERELDAKRAMGEEIAEVLRDARFDVVWDGHPETRLSIEGLAWKRRTSWQDSAPDEPEAGEPSGQGWLRRLFGG